MGKRRKTDGSLSLVVNDWRHFDNVTSDVRLFQVLAATTRKVVNTITIIPMPRFIMLSSWHCHCKSSPGSFDECSTSAGQPLTFGPSQSAWASDPPTGSYSEWLHSSSPFIIITQLDSFNTHFTITRIYLLMKPYSLKSDSHNTRQKHMKNDNSWSTWHTAYSPFPTLTLSVP